MKNQQVINFLVLVMTIMMTSTKASNFKYTVETYTSKHSRSDTDDSVYISFFGSKGTVSNRKLDNKSDNFERGRKDTFVLNLDKDLGMVDRIILRKTGDDGWRCDKVIVKSKHGSYTFAVYRWFDNEDGHQLSYTFENVYAMKKLTYHMDKLVRLGNKPLVIGKTTVTNKCHPDLTHICQEQSQTLHVSRTKESTLEFSQTAGVSITVGTEVTVGVPDVSSGKISTSITTSFSYTWGKSKSVSSTWTISQPCKAAPETSVTCEFYIYKVIIDVPFTIEWKNGKTTEGVYKAVDYMEGGFNAIQSPLPKER